MKGTGKRVFFVAAVVLAAALAGSRLMSSGPVSAGGGATATATSSAATEDGGGTASPDGASPSTSTATASPTASEEPSPSGTDVDHASPVTVLNGTSRAGLATRVAATLRSAGWAVGSLGNYRDAVLSTTVYYPDADLRAEARAVSSDLPGTQRVVRSTRFGSTVTVVVGLDYPD